MDSQFKKIKAKDLQKIKSEDNCQKFFRNRGGGGEVLIFGLVEYGDYLIGCNRDKDGEIRIWSDPVTFLKNYTEIPF